MVRGSSCGLVIGWGAFAAATICAVAETARSRLHTHTERRREKGGERGRREGKEGEGRGKREIRGGGRWWGQREMEGSHLFGNGDRRWLCGGERKERVTIGKLASPRQQPLRRARGEQRGAIFVARTHGDHEDGSWMTVDCHEVREDSLHHPTVHVARVHLGAQVEDLDIRALRLAHRLVDFLIVLDAQL